MVEDSYSYLEFYQPVIHRSSRVSIASIAIHFRIGYRANDERPNAINAIANASRFRLSAYATIHNSH